MRLRASSAAAGAPLRPSHVKPAAAYTKDVSPTDARQPSGPPGAPCDDVCYRLVVLPLDTTTEAASLQERAYDEMGISGRFRIALELSDLTHAFAVAGIRRSHPQVNGEEARGFLAGLLYQQQGGNPYK